MWNNDDFGTVYGFLNAMRELLKKSPEQLADKDLAAVLLADAEAAKASLDKIADALS